VCLTHLYVFVYAYTSGLAKPIILYRTLSFDFGDAIGDSVSVNAPRPKQFITVDDVVKRGPSQHDWSQDTSQAGAKVE